MNEQLVKDIMVPAAEYPCIPETHTLRQAIEEMGKAQILKGEQASLPRMALVFDETGTRLLGMLRRRDILRGLEPKFLVNGSLEYREKFFNVNIDPNLSELSYDKMIARIQKRASLLVREFMKPLEATIRHDDHIMKAINEMVDQNTSMLPVLKDDNVVGVVRSVDVLNAVALLIASKALLLEASKGSHDRDGRAEG